MPLTQVEVLITVPFSDSQLDQIKQLSPRLRVITQVARKVEEIPTEFWNRTEVLYTDRVLPEPAQVPNLRWVQFHFAGIDFASDSALVKKPEIAVTTLSGAASPQMAEYAVMMLMALGHRMPEIFANQNRMEWPHDRWERFGPTELRGSTVGIVGYGSIGREIARLLKPFGVSILASKKDVMHPEDFGYSPPDLGDPEGNYFTRLYPSQAIKSMVKLCDFVIICVPLTPESRNLFRAEHFEAMKAGAYLVNIGRGGVVNQTDLLTALQEKRLAGAALDVFSEEPLPSDSPLWHLPNVIITPHIGGISAVYRERAVALFSENIKRYLDGSSLFNRYDHERGY